MSFEVLSKKEKNWLGQEKDKPFAEVYSGKVVYCLMMEVEQ